MTRREEALHVLASWLADRGTGADTAGLASSWLITEYNDGFVFSPAGGRRSNLLYVVLGTEVAAFSPASATLEEVYAALEGRGGAFDR